MMMEFPSLVGLIHRRAKEQHDAVFCWYRIFQGSVRTQEHKLIVYPEARMAQLFDLRKDPWEITDLSSKPEHAALKSKLMERLPRFQRELGDDFADPA